MKKLLSFIVVLVMVFAVSSHAQDKFHLGVGPFVGIPMGSFGDVTSIGFGGLVQGELEFTPQVVGTGQIGYIVFSGKSVTELGYSYDYGNWSVIPVLAGVKYYFNPSFYGEAQLGLNFTSYTTTIPYYNYFTGTTTTQDVSASDTNFGYGFGVGYEIPVGAKGSIDFFAKFGSIASDAQFIGLSAFYMFM